MPTVSFYAFFAWTLVAGGSSHEPDATVHECSNFFTREVVAKVSAVLPDAAAVAALATDFVSATVVAVAAMVQDTPDQRHPW